jgi:hypothetical protein
MSAVLPDEASAGPALSDASLVLDRTSVDALRGVSLEVRRDA